MEDSICVEFFSSLALQCPARILFSRCLPHPSAWLCYSPAPVRFICNCLCSNVGPSHPGYFKLLINFWGMWTITMTLGVKVIRKAVLRERPLPPQPYFQAVFFLALSHPPQAICLTAGSSSLYLLCTNEQIHEYFLNPFLSYMKSNTL